MADAVIFDDGGSTRVKLLLRTGVGAMDDLLDVNANVPVAGRSGSKQKVKAAASDYGTIVISSIDPMGNSTTLPTAAFSTFELRSGNQRINGELVNNTTTGFLDLVITLHGPSANEPNVEAKQTRHKRRYVVANAPPIDEVFVDGASVYTAGTNVYTCVVIT